MSYEAEEVYEYDDPLEFEIERLKNEAAYKKGCVLNCLALFQQNSLLGVTANSKDINCILEQKDEALELSAKIGQSLLLQVNELKCRNRELKMQLDDAVEQFLLVEGVRHHLSLVTETQYTASSLGDTGRLVSGCSLPPPAPNSLQYRGSNGTPLLGSDWTYQLEYEKQHLQKQLHQNLSESNHVVNDSPKHLADSSEQCKSDADSKVSVTVLRDRVSELKLDNDRLTSEVSRLTGELDSVSVATSAEARTGRRREEILDRELKRLREKLDAKQRAVCQQDEQISSRNVELVFLAGQLVKMETEMEKMQSRLEASLSHSITLQDRFDEAVKQREEIMTLCNVLRTERSGPNQQRHHLHGWNQNIVTSAFLQSGFNCAGSALDEHRRFSDVLRLVNSSSSSMSLSTADTLSCTSSCVKCRISCQHVTVSQPTPTDTVASDDQWQQRLRALGQPGRPGSLDLDMSLGRNTLDDALPICSSNAVSISLSSCTCTTVSSHDAITSCHHCSVLSVGSQLPPRSKLQLVKVVEGSVLLNSWRNLSTPNMASVLDSRHGVLVRGDMNSRNDDPHNTTIVVTTVDSAAIGFRSSDSQSCSCGTFSRHSVSSSGILSRLGFPATVGQSLGLASILEHDPSCIVSSHKAVPSLGDLGSNGQHCVTLTPQCQKVAGFANGFETLLADLGSSDQLCETPRCQKITGFATSLDDLGSNNHLCATTPQCQKVTSFATTRDVPVAISSTPAAGETFSRNIRTQDRVQNCCLCHRTNPTGSETSMDHQTRLSSATSSNPCFNTTGDDSIRATSLRPSNVLEGDLELNITSGTTIPQDQSSPFCCGPMPHTFFSPPSHNVDDGCSSLSLYDELLPYLSEDERDVLSGTDAVTTDDEY